ncbi:MAG: hypothetical protein GC181_11385 [Bacteroidetes bacterium]|nr:hypothetical protein [Bacteroidota bacterium]
MNSNAGNDSTVCKNFINFQFGGQTIVSWHYERNLLTSRYYSLNANLGFGFNEYARDMIPDDRPIYCTHFGLVSLIGEVGSYIEIGLNPGRYMYKSIRFTNLNGWFGFRFAAEDKSVFLSIGYTPRLIYPKVDPTDKYFNIPIGLKAAAGF